MLALVDRKGHSCAMTSATAATSARRATTTSESARTAKPTEADRGACSTGRVAGENLPLGATAMPASRVSWRERVGAS